MNVNEVVAGLANEALTGKRGGTSPVHPNDHVNRGQSSNDSFPTAMHVAVARATRDDLLPALATLTDLAEPAEPVFAVASRHWPKGPETPPAIPTPDTGTCVVELWRYPPDATATHGRVDPLSLYLSLKDAKDERLQLALEGLMEQVAWRGGWTRSRRSLPATRRATC